MLANFANKGFNTFVKSLHEFKSQIKILFTDIDDTLTDEGLLGPEAYSSLWKLSQNGIHVVPVTGRPAGWCEMIARQWPIHGVIGENGAFYFRYFNKKMIRHFSPLEFSTAEMKSRLDKIKEEVLTSVPGSAVASDQFCRMYDLAIDFCEDVPALSQEEIKKIVTVFEKAGAQAKVSSIHVNGWFGSHNKMTMTLDFLAREFNIDASEAKKICAFVGDSPNDEPMFAFFPHSFAVENIRAFINQLKSPPSYVASQRGGLGFQEVAERILLFAVPQ
jgi:HAD superfamily hydrolase (TIGR01484 family)